MSSKTSRFASLMLVALYAAYLYSQLSDYDRGQIKARLRHEVDRLGWWAERQQRAIWVRMATARHREQTIDEATQVVTRGE